MAGFRPLRILLFDLYQGGHHLQYVQQLCQYWISSTLPGQIDIAVHEDVARYDDRLFALVGRGNGRIRVHSLRPRHDLQVHRRFRPIRNDFEHARLLKQAVRELKPDHSLCMYFDHIQLSLALNMRLPPGTSLSGIYFRPSFHYALFGEDRASPFQSAMRVLKRSLLHLSIRNPSVRYLFSLDPYAVDHIRPSNNRVVAVPLPDGIPPASYTSSIQEIRGRFRLGPNQKLGTLTGVLDERKGIEQLLESVFLLPSDVQQQLVILLSGPVRGPMDWLNPLIAKVESETNIRVILDNRYVPVEEIFSLLSASDFVLLPYQKHVGSSNVLIHAARASRPVIGQSYGLLGEQIRRWHLGFAVDSQSPDAIAVALLTLVSQPDRAPFDPTSAEEFASANTGERFAETILSRIYSI